MNSQRITTQKRGFTVLELLVAMVITVIIVMLIVPITSMAVDTWNRSRSELRASRQAKSMLDIMSKDLESLVARRGNTSEWLSATSSTSTSLPGVNLKSTNASKLIFFSAVTDRYNGDVGKAADKGGDVSCVGYQLDYSNAVSPTGSDPLLKTFILRRVQKNPDDVFTTLLGKTDSTDSTNPAKSLDPIFTAAYSSGFTDPKNFICENIYQFSLIFNVQVANSTTGVISNVAVSVGQANGAQTSKSFRIMGNGITTEITGGTFTAAQVSSGKVTSVLISLTVLSDMGVDQTKSRTFANDAAKAKFLATNSFQYAKLVPLPSM